MANETADDHLHVPIGEEIEMATQIGNLLAHIGRETTLATEIDDHLSHNSGENEMDIETLDDHSSLTGGDTATASEMDRLSIRILNKLRPPFLTCSGRSIFKVPKYLRDVNEKAYEPQVIAIGPYHRGKSHLMAMEEYKKLYLYKLLQRRGETDVKRYVNAMRALEGEARNCYADFIDLGTDEFVEMMLFDGCFIVELIRSSYNYIIKETWIFSGIYRDLLLVENQLPFFVLQKFFDMTLGGTELSQCLHCMCFVLFNGVLPKRSKKKEDSKPPGCRCMCFDLFNCVLPKRSAKKDDSTPERSMKHSTANIKHLVNLLHEVRRPSHSEGENKCELKYSIPKRCIKHFIANIKHLVNLLHDKCCSSRSEDKDKWELIRCVTELKEAGIKFKEGEKDSLFEITFKDGVMEIPRLEIEDGTETIFRNLIAYEQFFLDEDFNYVTDYVKFMDSLINSPKDVKLLCQRRIIHNWLGDEEVVANMFNRLGDFVTISPRNFFYSKLFNDVNQHCRKRCNKWMANLRHNYFNTPWALISFLAAVLLLLFTFSQTLFSILAYFK